MKSFIALAVASLVTAAAIGTATTAEARNKKGDFILNTKEGMVFYSKVCNDSGICGNWNIKG